MITLNLSPETQAVLEKMAAANNRSIEEQAELETAHASEKLIDWENWTAEEIIANIRASRYDRPRD